MHIHCAEISENDRQTVVVLMNSRTISKMIQKIHRVSTRNSKTHPGCDLGDSHMLFCKRTDDKL